MGTLVAGIVRVLGVLLAGIGAGKIADKIAPDKNLDVLKPALSDESGGLDMMKIIKWIGVTIVGAIITNMVLKFAGLRRYKLFTIAVSAGLFFAGLYTMFTTGDYVLGLLLATLPGGIGVTTSFNLTYVPEKISWNDGGNPLTSLRIETQEDGVIHDLSAAAIAAMNGILNVGALAANQVTIPVADGHIPNKNVQITAVTSAVGAINLFGSSDNRGVSLFQTKLANILANNETEFSKFSILFLPNLVTVNDRVQIFYKDGHSQIFDPLELDFWSSMYQDVQVRAVNNLPGYIDKVVITSALGGLAYVFAVKI